jgi:hypothetical protein
MRLRKLTHPIIVWRSELKCEGPCVSGDFFLKRKSIRLGAHGYVGITRNHVRVSNLDSTHFEMREYFRTVSNANQLKHNFDWFGSWLYCFEELNDEMRLEDEVRSLLTNYMKMKSINHAESSKSRLRKGWDFWLIDETTCRQIYRNWSTRSVQENAMHIQIQIHPRQEQFLIRWCKAISLNSAEFSFDDHLVLKDNAKKDDQKER